MAQNGYQSIMFHSGSEKRAAKLLDMAKTRYQIPDGVIRFCIDDAEFQNYEYCILGSSFALPLDEVAQDKMLVNGGPHDEEAMQPELVRQITLNSKPHQRMFGFAFPLPDVPNLIDIGKVIMPQANSVIGHQLLCPTGSMYACALGTAVHAMMRWDFHEFGEIDVSRLESCWSAARKLGCRVVSEKLDCDDLDAWPKVRRERGKLV